MHFESTFDRWRPGLSTRAWKEDRDQGGILWIWGRTLATRRWCSSASLRCRSRGSPRARWRWRQRRFHDPASLLDRYSSDTERQLPFFPGPAAVSFARYARQLLEMGSRSPGRCVESITKITDTNWGRSRRSMGHAQRGSDGSVVTRPVPSAAGDYRLFYADVREVLPVLQLCRRSRRLMPGAWPVFLSGRKKALAKTGTVSATGAENRRVS